MTEPVRPPVPTTSVALTTWNGSRHLAEQLQGILAQDRPPDEVVVRDDGSTDDSVALVERFARDAPFPVRVLPTERHLGVIGNVAVVVDACEGDVVVPCDQDDRWSPGKLRRIVEALAAAPDAQLLLADAELIDDRGATVAPSLWGRLGFAPGPHDVFRTLLTRTLVPGATIAFRPRHPLLLPLPDDLADVGLLHDGWIELVLAAIAPVALVAEPLHAYRLHDGQAVGLTRPTGTGTRPGDVERRLAQAERLRSHLAGEAPAAAADLDAVIEHLRRRASLPRRRPARLPAVAREWGRGRYRRWSSGWRSAVRDVFDR